MVLLRSWALLQPLAGAGKQLFAETNPISLGEFPISVFFRNTLTDCLLEFQEANALQIGVKNSHLDNLEQDKIMTSGCFSKSVFAKAHSILSNTAAACEQQNPH